MAIVTKEQLDNASMDATALEQFINGAVNLNGTGLVTSRLGASYKTLSKVVADAESTVALLETQAQEAADDAQTSAAASAYSAALSMSTMPYDSKTTLVAAAVVEGSRYNTRGYGAIGDGGNAVYLCMTLAAFADVPDELFHHSANGGTHVLALQISGQLDIRQGGAALDGSDESAVALAAVKAASAAGVPVCVPTGTLHAPTLEHYEFPNVRFVGEGKVTGTYRKKIIPFHAKTPKVSGNWFPKSALNALNVDNPTVVLVGDSISAYYANNPARGGLVTTSIELALRNSFPGMSYYNRSIQAQTFGRLDGIASSFPAWYVEQATPWLDYVEAFSPDCVILNFGMNDQDNFDNDALISVVSKINAWTKVPTIIFATNLVPSLDGKDGYPEFQLQDAQESRDEVAGYVRSYAQYYGYPLLDFNRMQTMARDGFDVVYGDLGDVETGLTSSLASTTDILSGSRAVYNCAYELTFNQTNFASVTIYLGGGLSTYLKIKNIGGFFRFVFYAGSDAGTAVAYSSIETAIPIGTGDITLKIEKYGNYVTIYDPTDANGGCQGSCRFLRQCFV